MIWIPLLALVVAFVILWWPDDEAAGELERRLEDHRRHRAARRRRRRRRGDPGLRILGRLHGGPATSAGLDRAGWRQLRDGLARTHRRL